MQAQHIRALTALHSQLEASQQSLRAVETAKQAAMTDAAACTEGRLRHLAKKHAKVCYLFSCAHAASLNNMLSMTISHE